MHFAIVQKTSVTYIFISIRDLSGLSASSVSLILCCICTDIIPSLIPAYFIIQSFHIESFPLRQQKQSPICNGPLSSVQRVKSDLLCEKHIHSSYLNCSGFSPDYVKLPFTTDHAWLSNFFKVYVNKDCTHICTSSLFIHSIVHVRVSVRGKYERTSLHGRFPLPSPR